MFKDPREYATALLEGNRERTQDATERAAKRMCFEAARVYPHVPAQFFADVLEEIDCLITQAEQEALADLRPVAEGDHYVTDFNI